MVKKNLLDPTPVWNFRNEDGYFPTDLRCSQCGDCSEVFIEIVRSGPILRLCKGCLTGYINIIDKTYQAEMTKS